MSDTGNGEQSTGQRVQDQPLTIREHLDPDKHWIGETLAPPTQTEISATVGITSNPGDSPFVARADHLHKIDPSILPKQYNAVGVADSGITTETVVCTLNIPAQSVVGQILVWWLVRVDLTVTTDRCVATLKLTSVVGAGLGSSYETGGGQAITSHLVAGVASMAANAILTVVGTVTRSLGTGTMTTYASNTQNRLIALWIPTI